MIRICTVGRDGARCAIVGKISLPIWTGKVYELRKRVVDGKPYLKFVGNYGPSMANQTPSNKLVEECKELAQWPFVEGVTARTKPSELPLGVLVG